MSLLTLPEIKTRAIDNIRFDSRTDAVKHWTPLSAKTETANSISIFGEIGEGWDGAGTSAKKVAGILRSMAGQPVTININSFGGDYFEGIAIYNVLRQHEAKVTVQVLGLAASAASVIAMAGDEILMGDGSLLMIHNAWCFAVGNRHDLVKASEDLQKIDDAMAELYCARSGADKTAITKLMDEESLLTVDESLKLGLASGVLDSNQIVQEQDAQSKKAMRTVESALAKTGFSRSERRDIIKSMYEKTSDMPSAATIPLPNVMPSADDNEVKSSIQELLKTLTAK